MIWAPRMPGDLRINGRVAHPAGFWGGDPLDMSGPQVPGFTRGNVLADETQQLIERMQRLDVSDLSRVDLLGDMAGLQQQLGVALADMQRALATTNTAFPMRENLEAPARILVPMDTPMRNRIPRVQGAGNAASWRQLISLGGGYGFATTVSSGATSVTQTLTSTAGIQVGDVLQFITATTGVPIGGTTALSLRTVTAVTATTVTVASIATVTGDLVVNTGNGTTVQGRPAGAVPETGLTAALSTMRSFFGETGTTAPGEKTEVYVAKSLGYKQLGVFGSITGRAMSSGATYQNQMATARQNSIRNLMLCEENSLINGSSTSLLPPWGDYVTAYGYDGLINLITTANGTPAANIQTSVGALTLSHIDAQLNRIWDQGGTGLWMLMSNQEIASLTHLAEAAGSIIRLQATSQGQAVLGLRVSGYVHPVSGEVVEIIASRYMVPGTIIFGADYLPDGTPSMAVDVLPQAQLPQLAPDQQIQGYTLQELAPTVANPLNYPWVVFTFQVLKLLGATPFAKSSSVTAV